MTDKSTVLLNYLTYCRTVIAVFFLMATMPIKAYFSTIRRRLVSLKPPLLILALLFLIGANQPLLAAADTNYVINTNGGQCSLYGANGGLAVYVGPTGQFQVKRCDADATTSSVGQYYYSDDLPTVVGLFNGLYLAIGNTIIGPYEDAGGNAAYRGDQAWTSVSGSGGSTLGDGTTEHVMTAVVDGLTYTLTQTVSYIFPRDYYSVSINLDVPAGNTHNLKLYSWTDLMLNGNDKGYCDRVTNYPEYLSGRDATGSVVAGYQQNSTTNHWDHYFCGLYVTPFNDLKAALDLSDTFNTAETDIGAAVQWSIGTVADTTFTADYDFVFSNNIPTLTKRYGPDDGDTNHTITTGQTTQLSLIVTNTSPKPAQRYIDFTETLPANVSLVGTPVASQCGGTVSVGTSGGRDTVTLTSGELATGAATCEVVVDVTSTTSGVYDDPPENVMATRHVQNKTQAELTVLNPGAAFPEGSGLNNSVCSVTTPAGAYDSTGLRWSHNKNGGTDPDPTIDNTSIFASATAATFMGLTANINNYELNIDADTIPAAYDPAKYIEYTFTTTNFGSTLAEVFGVGLAHYNKGDAADNLRTGTYRFAIAIDDDAAFGSPEVLISDIQLDDGDVSNADVAAAPTDMGFTVQTFGHYNANGQSIQLAASTTYKMRVYPYAVTANGEDDVQLYTNTVLWDDFMPKVATCAPKDHADAPTSGTSPNGTGTNAYGDAPHIITGGVQLGATITSEPNAVADADNASDDGITFPTLEQGQSAMITAAVSGAGGYLQGWIDWNGNGTFENSDRVAENKQLASGTSGTIDLLVFPPHDAVTTPTTARFRWSTEQDLDTTSDAPDGEVEDYTVTVLPSLPVPAQESCSDISHPLLRPKFTSPTNQTPILLGDTIRFPNIATLDGQSIDMVSEVIGLDGLGEVTYFKALSGGTVKLQIESTSRQGLGTVVEAIVKHTFVKSGTLTSIPVTAEFTITDIDFDKTSRLESLTVHRNEVAAYSLASGTTIDVAYDGDNLTFIGTIDDNPPNPKTAIKFLIDHRSDFTVVHRAQEVHPTNTKGINQVGFEYNMFDLKPLPACTQTEYSDAPADGEVAPNTTDTTAYGAVKHVVNHAFHLGAEMTAEGSAIADADNASDDGITFPTLEQGQSATIKAAVTGTGGYLQGWIDWNGNGTFEDSDRVADNKQLATGASGTIDLLVFPPHDAVTTPTTARFRWSTKQSLDATSDAPDGEVEDYTVTVMPSLTLPPQEVCSDISHPLLKPKFTSPTNEAPLLLGDTIRFPNIATLDGQSIDMVSEVIGLDGLGEVTYFKALSGGTVKLQIESLARQGLGTVVEAVVKHTFVKSGTLTPMPITAEFTINDIDLDDDSRLESLTIHRNEVSDYSLDPDTKLEVTYDGDNLTFMGTIDVEVESGSITPKVAIKFLIEDRSSFTVVHRAQEVNPSGEISRVGFEYDMFDLGPLPACTQIEYSDAPADNEVAPNTTDTTAYGVAEHTVNHAFHLGDKMTAEGSATADSDNVSDDGITFPTLIQGTAATITATVNGKDGYLQGWVDWNGDGNFSDAGEKIATDLRLATPSDASGTISIPVTPPADAITDQTYARFRWSTDMGLDSTTAASDGEVEDYAFKALESGDTCILSDGTTVTITGEIGSQSFVTPSNLGTCTTAPYTGLARWTGPGRPPLVYTFSKALSSVDIVYTAVESNDAGVISTNAAVIPTVTVASQCNRVTVAGTTITNVLSGFGPANLTVASTEPFTQVILQGSEQLIHKSGCSGFTNLVGVYDSSDAPADGSATPSGTGTTSYGEATHTLVSTLQLGAAIDADSTSIASAAADGDGADDDGITIPALPQGETATITATVTGTGGYLQGWIDWDGNGAFDAGEQVAADLQDGGALDTDTTTETIAFAVTVPAGATTEQTFARFRWSTTAGLDSTTAANDGEVEDYAISITSAPIVVTPTTGPNTCSINHKIEWAPVTASAGSNAASFQHPRGGTVGVNLSEEYIVNGTEVGPITQNAGYPRTITTTNTSLVNIPNYTSLGGQHALVSRPSDGRMGDIEQVTSFDFSSITGGAGSGTVLGIAGIYPNYPTYYENSRIIIEAIKADGTTETDYTGWGFAQDANQDITVDSSVFSNPWEAGGSSSGGFTLIAGEVASYDGNSDSVAAFITLPDHANYKTIRIKRYITASGDSYGSFVATDAERSYFLLGVTAPDYGDAPDSYKTTKASAGARHDLVCSNELYLGSNKGDPDDGTLTNAAANADDSSDTDGTVDGTNDEDGVTIPTLTQGTEATITATVNGTGGYLQGWIDWNGDGDFDDADEQVVTDFQDGDAGDTDAAVGTIAFNVTPPATATTSQTYARFRWSTTAGLNSTADASDGEVEDYAISITSPPIVVTPTTGPNTCSINHKIEWAPVTASAGSNAASFQHPRGGTVGVNLSESYTSNGTEVGPVTHVSGYPKQVTTTNTSLVNIPNYTSLGGQYLLASWVAGGTPNTGRLSGDMEQVISLDFSSITGGAGSGTVLGIAGIYPDYSGFYDDPRIIIEAIKADGTIENDYSDWGFAQDTNQDITVDGAVLSNPWETGGSSSQGFTLLAGEVASYSGNDDSVAAFITLPDGANYNTIRIKRQVATSASALPMGGQSRDGEKSFLFLGVTAPDYGDAPDSYKTTKASAGARHDLVCSNELYLGSNKGDPDDGTLTNAAANADDSSDTDGTVDGTNDEDGVTIPTLTQGTEATITATVNGTGGYLQGWIDWNGDGDFDDADEQVVTDFQDGDAGDTDAAVGTIAFNVTPPATATTSQTYARFRWSTTAGLNSTADASDGEVEDYAISITSPPIVVTPTTGPNSCSINHNIEWAPVTASAGSNAASFLHPRGGTVGVNLSESYTSNGTEVGPVTQGSGYPKQYTITHTGLVNIPNYTSLGDQYSLASWTQNLTVGDIEQTISLDFNSISGGAGSGTVLGIVGIYPDYPDRYGDSRVIVTAIKADGTIETDYSGWGFAQDASQNIEFNSGKFVNPWAIGGSSSNGFTLLAGEIANTNTSYVGDSTAAFITLPDNANYKSISIVRAVTTTNGTFYNNSGALRNAKDYEMFYLLLGVTAPDYGDAPDSYKTTKASAGARHDLVCSNNLYLGSNKGDPDDGTLTNATATADDSTDTDGTDDGTNDEDGVTIPVLTQGAETTITATVNGVDGYLQGWIDWNGDGDFSDAGEQVVTDLQDGAAGDTDATAGTIAFVVTPPATAMTNQPFARFRWSTTAGLDSTTSASDGEVEDYAVTVMSNDYSDAPITGTAPDMVSTNDYGEATHVFVSTLKLGAAIDADNTSLASPNADGDGADDDGVTVFPPLTPDSNNYQLSVTASNTTGNPGRLLAWIDFDGNGRFDSDEAAARVVPTGTTSGNFLMTWAAIPPDIQAGNTFLRVRLTTDALNAGLPSGERSDGEVEDYQITIASEGAVITGRVYVDANSSGSEDAGEGGVGGSVVVLHDITANTCRSVMTSANGDYVFTGILNSDYEIYQAHGDTTPVPQNCGSAFANNPTGLQSTTDDLLTVTVAGNDVNNQNFGEVIGANSPTSGNTGVGLSFEPDHQSKILPGNTTLYAHTLTSKVDGSVRFTEIGSDNFADGWTHAIYRDTDCNGVLNGTEGNTTISGINFGLNAGARMCIINKVYAPAGVPAQDRYNVDITATFTFPDRTTGPATPPITLSVTDLTIAGQTVEPTTPSEGESRLVLTKTVENQTQMSGETETLNYAAPGDVLRYRIYYHNTGTGPVTNLRVNDSVPPYTALVGSNGTCDVTPSGMTCSPTHSADAMEWTFTGPLVGGANGYVSYEVKVDN